MWLLRLLITASVGYLLGAIPTGLLVGRLYRGIDVRDYGSSSTGATNVLRTLGPVASACVALADFLKGLLAVQLIRQLYPEQRWTHALAAFAAAVGHDWPLFAGFRGGKGVLTSLGGVMPLHRPTAYAVVGLGVVVLWRTRLASLASLIGTSVAPVILVTTALRRNLPAAYAAYGVGGAALIVLRHRENIARLLAGTERRLGEQEASPPSPDVAQ